MSTEMISVASEATNYVGQADVFGNICTSVATAIEVPLMKGAQFAREYPVATTGVAAVAVLGLGYLAYRKFTSSKDSE